MATTPLRRSSQLSTTTAMLNAYYLVRGLLLGARIISTESNATLCQLQALEFYNRTQEA